MQVEKPTVTVDVGYVSLTAAVVAFALLWLPGGWTWLAMAPAVAAIVTGVRGLRRYGAGWASITGLVVGSGVAVLLALFIARIVWLNTAL